jgi:hypothetical protein
VRTPGAIPAHICDLLDWTLTLASGKQAWRNLPAQGWEQDVERFYASLRMLDDYLASDQVLHAAPENLFQGPIADALTHVGQIGMLRRMAGIPVKGENYFRAGMKTGNVGRDQDSPAFEFN